MVKRDAAVLTDWAYPRNGPWRSAPAVRYLCRVQRVHDPGMSVTRAGPGRSMRLVRLRGRRLAERVAGALKACGFRAAVVGGDRLAVMDVLES